jgi:hypothetical protein
MLRRAQPTAFRGWTARLSEATGAAPNVVIDNVIWEKVQHIGERLD